nr:hypothetical protein [Tanacetum cinerariifolium]
MITGVPQMDGDILVISALNGPMMKEISIERKEEPNLILDTAIKKTSSIGIKNGCTFWCSGVGMAEPRIIGISLPGN